MNTYDIAENYEILDFHTHPFSDEKQQTCMYPDYVTSMEKFEADMEACHISTFAGSVIHRKGIDITSFQQIKALNDDALRLRERMKGKYIPGFHVNPHFVGESIQEIERMKKEGVKLVGELVPYSMGWENYDEPGMQQIYEAITANRMIVSLHTMAPDSIERAVAANPDLIFVAAHPGQPDQVKFHVGCMKKYDNYYLDLSGTGMFRYGIISYVLKETKKNHLLFGTDYPITNPYMYVQAVLGERLSRKDNEAIFSKNAKMLLEI